MAYMAGQERTQMNENGRRNPCFLAGVIMYAFEAKGSATLDCGCTISPSAGVTLVETEDGRFAAYCKKCAELERMVV